MTKRTLLRTLERERTAYAAERAQLIATICKLAANRPLHNEDAPPPIPEIAVVDSDGWTQT